MTIKFKKQPERKSFLEEEVVYSGSKHQDTSISLIQFNDAAFEHAEVENCSNLKDCLKENFNNWVIVSGLSDNKKLSDVFSSFDLHTVDVKGILEVDDHSAISDYSDKVVFRAVNMAFDEKGALHQEQESFILGKDYLVSLVEGSTGNFDDVIYAIENSKVNLRTKGCDYLFVILLDKIISQYREVIDRIERNLEKHTEVVISASENDSLLVDMVGDRQAYIKLKHIVYSMKDSITRLLRNPNGIISPDMIVYVEDIMQQIQFISQDIESCDQAFNSIVNLHFNNNNQKMNDIMKRLTVISTIFLPMTFFVGLWGMNFTNMPETQWEYGYFIAWCIILITAILSWYYLKKKRWL